MRRKLLYYAKFLLTDAIEVFRWRVPLLVFLMVVTGVLEGLAVTIALPLLSSLGASDTNSTSGFVNLLEDFLNTLGLPQGPIGIGVLMLVLITGSTITFIWQARLAAKLQAEYVLRWQNNLFRSAIAAGPVFLDTQRDGDVIAAIIADSTRVSGAFFYGCVILAAIVSLFIYLCLAILISPHVSFAVLIMGGLLLLATRVFLARAYGYGEKITQAQGDVQLTASEYLSQSKAVKANVAEARANTVFSEAAARLAGFNVKNAFDIQRAKAVFEFGAAAGIAGLLIAVPLLFEIDIPTVIVVLALFVRLMPRISGLQQGTQAMSALLPGLGNLKQLVEKARVHAEAADDRPLPHALSQGPPSIRFDGVSIERGGKAVLTDINLHIPSGKTVAFVGPSGSGKSTLVDAVLGLVPLSAGEIRIGASQLADVPLPAWRRSIGYVAQEAALFSGTIRENVNFGKDLSQNEIEVALERAAARFVRQLALGIDTLVGDRGARLSGGERQRVGLARALSTARQLYVLDEATSALDSETESRVGETFRSLAGTSTVIVVAHRFSAVRTADLIHVLEEGRLVESGTWAQLDRPGTRFRVLKDLQNTPSLPEAI